MDRIDLGIIGELTEDARTSFRSIAKKLKVSPDTIANRYSKLMEDGVICGSTVVIDPKKIGYQSMVVFMIDANPKYFSQILDKLISMPSIIIASKTIGDSDLIAIGVSKDFDDLENHVLKISALKGVTDVEVSFWTESMEICPEYFIL